jgi:hypothetical protein
MRTREEIPDGLRHNAAAGMDRGLPFTGTKNRMAATHLSRQDAEEDHRVFGSLDAPTRGTDT